MPEQQKPTIVLVHGLWVDGSFWNETIALLLPLGFEIIVVQNPLTSLEDDVAAVRRALDRAGGPVVLVGHSWGGFVVTAAGDDPRVKALVYLTALVPDEGETVNEMAAAFEMPQLMQHVSIVSGYVWLDRDAMPYFAGDTSKERQEQLFVLQQPANSELANTPFRGKPAWKERPCWYLVTDGDNAINPDHEQFMAERIGAKLSRVTASHVPMISHPDLCAGIIKEAAASTTEA